MLTCGDRTIHVRWSGYVYGVDTVTASDGVRFRWVDETTVYVWLD